MSNRRKVTFACEELNQNRNVFEGTIDRRSFFQNMRGDLLIAAQPTRGVDIGAIESIRTTLENVKKDGKAILLVSADLDEVMDMSDRIVVMYEGKITGILDAKDATKEEVGLYMLGQAEQDRKEA